MFPDPHNQNLSQSVTKKLYRGAAEVCLNHSAYSPKLADSGNPRKISVKRKSAPTPLTAIRVCAWKFAFYRHLARCCVSFCVEIFDDSPRIFRKIHVLSRSVPKKTGVARRHVSQNLIEGVQNSVDRSQPDACSLGDLARRFQCPNC